VCIVVVWGFIWDADLGLEALSKGWNEGRFRGEDVLVHCLYDVVTRHTLGGGNIVYFMLVIPHMYTCAT